MLSAIDNSTVPITVASLLDHMDWMTDRMINEEITHLIKKMDPVRGKIFWRTFADDVHSAPLNWLRPDRVDDHDDRVGMYWTTWIAYLKDITVTFEERVDTMQDKGFAANFITGIKVVTFPLWKPLVASTLKATGHAKDMESFYKYQKEGYDAFREGLLHAKPALIESMHWTRRETWFGWMSAAAPHATSNSSLLRPSAETSMLFTFSTYLHLSWRWRRRE